MDCTLFLMRHGIAEDAGPGVSDAERALTTAGGRKVARSAVGLRRLGARPEIILTSPLLRARQTAERLQQFIGHKPPIEIYQPLTPGHDPEEVLHELVAYRGLREIVLVGHQPDLGELASYLVSGTTTAVSFDVKKGSVIAIQVGTLPPRAPGLLCGFLTSKQLRLIGRRRG